MNYPTMILLVGVFGLVLLLSLGIVLERRQHKAYPMLLPDGDPTRLCYCEGCGCRHRQEYMQWKDSGAYRCNICCRESTVPKFDLSALPKYTGPTYRPPE